MLRTVWIGEIRGGRAKRTHGWLGCRVDSNREAQRLPGVLKAPTVGQVVTGFTMVPTSAHTGGAGAADGAQVPPPGCAILFPTGSSCPLVTTAAETGRCHIKINEPPGAGQLACSHTGWIGLGGEHSTLVLRIPSCRPQVNSEQFPGDPQIH